MEYLAIGAIIVGVAAVAVLAANPRGRVFVIRVRNGFPTVTKGKVSQAFVAELAGTLRDKGIRSGSIFGVRKRNTVSLEFSRSIPKVARQSLRNVWAMHGR
jgi:hypothetical protein